MPEAPPVRFDLAKDPPSPFDIAKEQASVVGSDVIAFSKGVSAETRGDIQNAVLLAQLVAKNRCRSRRRCRTSARGTTPTSIRVALGFVLQDKALAEYRSSSDTFEAHESILEIAGALLAGSPGALVLVKKTLEALQKMSADSPFITLFHRESHRPTPAASRCRSSRAT